MIALTITHSIFRRTHLAQHMHQGLSKFLDILTTPSHVPDCIGEAVTRAGRADLMGALEYGTFEALGPGSGFQASVEECISVVHARAV